MATRERLISTREPDAWREALLNLPHAYWHTWEACTAAHVASGLPTWLYEYKDDNGNRAVCPFSERRFRDSVDIFTPAGFSGFSAVGDIAMLREHWRTFVATQNYVCGYFALHPKLAIKSMHQNLIATNDLFVKGLGCKDDTALAGVDRSVRRSVRQWESENSRYVTDRKALSGFILANYRPFMTAIQANPSAMWSDEGLEIMCQDPAVSMVGAEDEHGICAVYTFAVTAFGAECHLNISVREGRQFTTPLLWWGIRMLSDQDIPWVNLGGGVTRNDAVATAKLKYRPDVFPLQTAREVYNEQTYQACCVAVGADASAREGFFPRYQQRQL